MSAVQLNPGYALRMREAYDATLRELAKRQVLAEKVNSIAVSYLRQAATLVNGQGQYTFPFKLNEAAQPNGQLLLDRNDVFYATFIGFHIANEVIAEPGSAVLQTYPNPTAFNGGSYIAADLEAIYRGYWSFTADQKTVYTKVPMLPHRVVPVAQQGDPLSTSVNTDSAPDVATVYRRENSAYGFFNQLVPLTPNLVLWGNNENFLNVQIPTWAGQDIEDSSGTTRNILVADLYGILVTGINRS